MKYMVGVDVGGTFTDLTVVDIEKKTQVNHKVRSTPDDPSIAIMIGINEITQKYDVPLSSIDYLAHGTTVATNALIEHKGSRTGLLITKGFKDLLEIGDQTRPSLYDLFRDKPTPFVEGKLRKEVIERLYSDGSVREAIDLDALREHIQFFKDQDVKSIAVCLLFSYINPEHEKIVAGELKRLFPEAYVSVSHEIIPEFREYPRLSTTVLNAYLGPVIQHYMSNFQNSVREQGIKADPYITQSNGGVISIQESVSYPIRTAVSGPAAGVVAAAHLGNLTGLKNMITFDVGGTSADISLIENGVPQISTERSIEGFPAKIPMLDIVTIGAGGGSIARVDEGGALKVGPESAGSKPGPACYGTGGDLPTVTDANAILGRLNPKGILGGRMALDVDASFTAVKNHVCEETGMDVERAAMGIIDVVNANMIRAIRLVSVEKGHDPRNFTLVAFGGAGGLQACSIAKDLGIPNVLIPPASGTFCSMGLLVSDIRSDYVRTYPMRGKDINQTKIQDLFKEMKAEGESLLKKENVPNENRRFIFSIDARYVGQNYELAIYFNEDHLKDPEILKQLFHAEHKKVYGYDYIDSPIEFVNFRLQVIGEQPKAPIRTEACKHRNDVPIKEYRSVYFKEGNTASYRQTPIYSRDELIPGDTIAGPAVIEQMDSTVVVLPNQKMTVDSYFNILIHVNIKETTQ